MHIITYTNDERPLADVIAFYSARCFKLTGKIIAGEVVLVARGR